MPARADAQGRLPEPRSGVPPHRAEGKHRRAGRRRGRWRRRLLAYRAVELLQSPVPGTAGEECLLLVHIRKVVGQVFYRACDECAEGVITDVVIDGPFRDSGLGTRALSHLRSRYPGVTWRATDDHRLARDLLHRMRIPHAAGDGNCSHLRSSAVAAGAG
ncbi:hypothetical protein ACH4F6_14950 [Streptomyces sp. NPDC017936]|uniref:hypothetical protein n=1 Tax=Streptomyces sp. NPDC017936 TaxID=3365016 RepID=UPI0037AE5360